MLKECQHCGLVQVFPRPSLSQLADYYLADYRDGVRAGTDVADTNRFPKDNFFYYNRGQSITDLLSLHIQKENPRILDVGAGFGHVLYALGKEFPDSDRIAIEPSEVCAKHLESLGLQVYRQPVEVVLPKFGGQFDLVVLSHVLEHLIDPVSVIRSIHKLLAECGVLYIEVPHVPYESLLQYPDSIWSPRFDEPHITFFSLSTLSNFLNTLSFQVEFCETAGPVYEYISSIRFHLPHWRWFIQAVIPPTLFHFLRDQDFTKPFRVKEREENFYNYGGLRIWIRSVSRKKRL